MADPIHSLKSPLSRPGFDRDAYNELVDFEVERIGSDPRARRLELERCSLDEKYFFRRYYFHEDLSARRVTRLILNEIQLRLDAMTSHEIVALKSRKAGLSTLIEAKMFHRALFRPHHRGVVIAHDRDSTNQLFDRLKFAHGKLPAWMRQPLEVSSRKELVFRNLGSHLRALTAGSAQVGRGSDIDDLHLSEAAFYPNLEKIMLGVGQAMRPGGRIWWESTANGFNEFREIYVSARDGRRADACAAFFEWWCDPVNATPVTTRERAEIEASLSADERQLRHLFGLTIDQVKWRRDKREKLGDKFAQEYPEDDETCFMTSGTPKFDVRSWRRLLVVVERSVKPLESPSILVRRRNRAAPADVVHDKNLTIWEAPEQGRSYVVGCDVAEGLPPDGDFSVGGVLDVTDLARRRQVAEWHGYISPGDFGLRMAGLATFFNLALLAIERNNHGHATIRAARVEAGYGRMYRHREFDQFSQREGLGKIGFPTNAGTRRTLLDSFARSVSASEHLVRSAGLCREVITFQAGDEDDGDERGPAERRKKRKRKNDRVFAWAIADWAALKATRIFSA